MVSQAVWGCYVALDVARSSNLNIKSTDKSREHTIQAGVSLAQDGLYSKVCQLGVAPNTPAKWQLL